MKKRLLLLFLFGNLSAALAQTVTDGLMMSKNAFCTGVLYGHDKWNNYWEGELKRDNQNIGSLTTQSVMWVGNYGITPKINVIAMLPYVWTKASGGTLHGMSGLQDVTIAAKYNFFTTLIGTGTFKTFGVLALSAPVTNYTPDFFPLSIGTATKNISWRLTTNYKFDQGIYVNASGAYTWKSNTTLDRPSYYTNNKLYLTDEVKMPNTFDFVVHVGYLKNGLQTEVFYTQQNTLGGSDIRRQDMPFVSNRMNFSKAGALVMYYLPKPKNLAVRASGSYTLAGRNVGQSINVMGGFLYTIHFFSSKPKE
jgi:hypothetical protein